MDQLGSDDKNVDDYAQASAAYKRLLSLNPFQEEIHMELAETQYMQYRSKFKGAKIEEVKQRIDFIMTINPVNGKGKKFLKELIENDIAINNESS